MGMSASTGPRPLKDLGSANQMKLQASNLHSHPQDEFDVKIELFKKLAIRKMVMFMRKLKIQYSSPL